MEVFMKPLVIPEDIEKLSVITYRIYSGYEIGKGMPQYKSNKFYGEILDKVYPTFKKRGWKWEEPTIYGASPEIVNQEDTNKRIYLHPLEFNAYGSMEDQILLNDILTKGDFKTFNYMDKYISEIPYYNCSVERVEDVYRMNKDIIKDNIVERISLGASLPSIFYNEISNYNKILNTGEANFYTGSVSSDIFSNVFKECLQELQDDRIIEKDKTEFTLCRKHNEPYITVDTVKSNVPNRGIPFYRAIATIKTKDCIPVATLYFYPDGADLKGIRRLNSDGVENEVKFFVQANKKRIEKLGELINNKEEFKAKQKELVLRWKEHYLNNTLSFSR